MKKALTASNPVEALGLLHEEIDTDAGGKDTLLACAGWFFDRHCWADAADAYAGYLHLVSTPFYEIRHAQALVGAGHLEEAATELGHLRSAGLDEFDKALALIHLPLTSSLQGVAFPVSLFANHPPLHP